VRLGDVVDQLLDQDRLADASAAEQADLAALAASTPREFLSAAAKLFPNHKIDLGPGPSKLGRSKQSYCIFDISAAQRNIGYEPAYTVEQGVKDYVETLDRLGR
jgi:nucleoside-diphosphate-sugar epimerase